jgi:hypothetical protein
VGVGEGRLAAGVGNVEWGGGVTWLGGSIPSPAPKPSRAEASRGKPSGGKQQGMPGQGMPRQARESQPPSPHLSSPAMLVVQGCGTSTTAVRMSPNTTSRFTRWDSRSWFGGEGGVGGWRGEGVGKASKGGRVKRPLEEAARAVQRMRSVPNNRPPKQHPTPQPPPRSNRPPPNLQELGVADAPSPKQPPLRKKHPFQTPKPRPPPEPAGTWRS